MKNITKHIVYALMLSVICINFISIASASPFLEYYSGSIDDDNSGSSSGNSNGRINPEETIEISITIENNGNTDVSGVTGQLRLKKSNPYVTIIDDSASYGTIGSNERKTGTFVFYVSDVQKNSIYESISFEIMLTDSSGNTWTDSFTKNVDVPSNTATATATATEIPTSESTDTDTTDSTVTQIIDSEDMETYNFPPSKYTIDGYSNDWSSLQPIVTDQKGDGVNGVSGTDIKALYTDSDENYLYLMMELWDGPTNPHIDEHEMFDSGYYAGRYEFQLINNKDDDIFIIFRPDVYYSGELNGPQYSFRLKIWKSPPDGLILYDSTGHNSDIDKSQNVLYFCKDVIEIQIPWDVIENPDVLRVKGDVIVAHELTKDKVDFEDRTDHNEQIISLFQVSDFKDLSGLIIKLQKAQDPLSQYLRDQFSEETLRLLDEYNGQGPPSEALQKALIDELNRILQNGSLYDEQRFENIKLSDDVLELIEGNPQGQDLVELNRMLLEEAYPQEIEKHKVKESKHVPGFMGFSSILSILFMWGIWKFA